MPEDLLDQLDQQWQKRLRYTMTAASVLRSASEVDTGAQASRDYARHETMRREEISRKLNATEWELPQYGLVGTRVYQYSDGDLHGAGIVMMGNYPPAHPNAHGFTCDRDGADLLSGGGIQSPSLSGNYQFAFSNVVPRFFQVGPQGESLSIPSGNGRKHYPSPIIQELVKSAAQDVLDRCANGTAQFCFTFGANGRKMVDQVFRLASASSDFEVTTLDVCTRPIRRWETGSLCLESLLLAHRYRDVHRGHRITHKDLLFGVPKEDLIEQSAVEREKGPAIDRHSSNIYSFVLISSASFPDRSVVLLSSDHMSLASHVAHKPDINIGARLDVATTLAEDLYFGRFETNIFPMPSWRFASRKNQSTLWMNSVQDKKDCTGFLGDVEIALLKTFRDSVEDPFRIDGPSLPAPYGRLYTSATLVPDRNGIPLDISDAVEIILATSAQRKKSLQSRSLNI